MRNFFKKVIFTCCTSIMILSTTITADASITYVIDNDPLASSGYGMEQYNFSYQTSSKYYNGDARLCTSTNGSYYWKFSWTKSSYSGINVKWRVYLNSSNFTNPKASYYLNNNGNIAGHSEPLGDIDQNRAPAGWGDYTTAYVPSTMVTSGYGYICEYVYLSPNGNSGTGADTIELIFPS